MRKEYLFPLAVAFCAIPLVSAQGAGHPVPGSPADTLNIYLKRAASGMVQCPPGGQTAFVRYDDATGALIPADISVSMVDWEQKDNDRDGVYDEDIPNGRDDDGDGKIDEDGIEPGATTGFIDCDGLDNEIVLQVRDSEPGKGVVSTQEWFIRMDGKPGKSFAFWTNTDQVKCAVEADPDGVPSSGDEVVQCSHENAAWVGLGHVDLSDYEGNCLKQVKRGGEGNAGAPGKASYCNLTHEFEVDVDRNNDGSIDPQAGERDQHLFSVSCVDAPGTTADESASCPFGRMIWGKGEGGSLAKAQVVVGHTGFAVMKGDKITERGAN